MCFFVECFEAVGWVTQMACILLELVAIRFLVYPEFYVGLSGLSGLLLFAAAGPRLWNTA